MAFTLVEDHKRQKEIYADLGNGVDPKCASHLMSAGRYFLTEMVKANADPDAEARQT
jgi:hypothetical protein